MSTKRAWGAASIVAIALVLAGCSSEPIDPELTSAVSSAISSGASAQIGLELSTHGRILPGTLTALLGDMAGDLADTERTLEMHQATDADDAQYRDEALSGVRASLEAVHVAQGGDQKAGLAGITASLDDLRALEQGS